MFTAFQQVNDLPHSTWPTLQACNLWCTGIQRNFQLSLGWRMWRTIHFYTEMDYISPMAVSLSLVKHNSTTHNTFNLADPSLLGPIASCEIAQSAQAELCKYLLESHIAANACPLAWWKQNMTMFLHLAHMAWIYLAIPGKLGDFQIRFFCLSSLYH